MADLNETGVSGDEICECGHRLDRHSAPLKIGGFTYVHYYGCDVELCECAGLLENKPEAVPYRESCDRSSGITIK